MNSEKFRKTTGTYSDPYARRDGVKMVKLGLSVPVDFARDVKLHLAHLAIRTSMSEWVVDQLWPIAKGERSDHVDSGPEQAARRIALVAELERQREDVAAHLADIERELSELVE